MGMFVQGFGINFEAVNLEMKKNEKEFSEALIAIHALELIQGFKVKKINKTTKNGTKVRYILIQSEEELKGYIEKINQMVEECNGKYGSGLKKLNWSDFKWTE